MAINEKTGNDRFEDRGYRPLNEGYTPKEKGYAPNEKPANTLPKSPVAGTGQTVIKPLPGKK